MLAPAQVEPIRIMRWQYDGADHQIPAVFHSVWRGPDGRLGWTLANWTNEQQVVTVIDPRLANQVTEYQSAQENSTQPRQVVAQQITLELPPLGCALLASESQ